MARSTQYYFVKISRISGWALLILVGGYLFTGYVVSGKFGLNRLLNKEAAVTFHRAFDLPLLLMFATHSFTSIYFALKRWRWLK